MNLVSLGDMPVNYGLVRSRGEQYVFPVPSLKVSSDSISYKSANLKIYSIYALQISFNRNFL